MEQFSQTAAEQRILREWLSHLEILDLLSGETVSIISDEKGKRGGDPHDLRKLFLAPRFSIGSYSLRDKAARESIRPPIEQVLTSSYERNWLNHMMSTINEPLALEKDATEYYDGIAKMIAEATFARVAIMHIFDPDSLEPSMDELPVTGIFDRDELLHEFRDDFKLPNARPVFREFLDSEDPTILKLGVLYDNQIEIGHYVADPDIATLFVVPLTLGGDRRGYLAIAFNIPIALSDTLDVAFLSIGGHSLAATENYRQIRTLDDLRMELLQKHLAGTQVELLQGFRHVAGGALGNAQYAFEKIAASRDARIKGMEVHYTDLDNALDTISDALAQMRSIKKVQTGLKKVDIIDVFTEATELTSYQLKKGKITVKKEATGSMITMAHESALRYAFSNLLLNSVQAFEDGGLKSNRTITLVGRETDREIHLEFSDNGPGLRLGRGTIKTANDIWKPGSTSKVDGTGYGLPFVRDVIQKMHKGSIDINPSSSTRGMGLSFIIRLPKRT